MLSEGRLLPASLRIYLRDCAKLLAKLVAREINDDGCCNESEHAKGFSVGRCVKQRSHAADFVHVHA
jgi:hypothetical protein